MTEGVHLWEFPVDELAIFVAVAVCYLLVGFVGFRCAERRARDRGLFGHY